MCVCVCNRLLLHVQTNECWRETKIKRDQKKIKIVESCVIRPLFERKSFFRLNGPYCKWIMILVHICFVRQEIHCFRMIPSFPIWFHKWNIQLHVHECVCVHQSICFSSSPWRKKSCLPGQEVYEIPLIFQDVAHYKRVLSRRVCVCVCVCVSFDDVLLMFTNFLNEFNLWHRLF